jgi:hypothetical protein
VEQTFEANNLPFISALEEMVGECEHLADAIQGDIDKIIALETAVRGLDGKTVEVTVNVIYNEVNKPDVLQDATQVIKQVVIPPDTSHIEASITQQLNINPDDLQSLKNMAADLSEDAVAARDASEAVSSFGDDARDASDSAVFLDDALARLTESEVEAAEASKILGDTQDGLSGSALVSAAAQEALKRSMDDTGLSGRELAGIAAQAAYAMTATGAATRDSGDALGDAIPLWEAGSGIFGGWNPKVQLFAGALTQAGIPAILGSASAFHILADASIEVAATLIPASIAFAAFGIAAAGDVMDIYNRMNDLFGITVAFQQNVYPFTGALTKMQDAVQPEVYLLFGEALDVVNKNTGAFTDLAVSAGHVLDELGARIAVAMTNGNGFNTFLHNATSDLAGWGDLIGNIFGILGNLLKTMPGYAQLFLQFADGVTAGIEHITSSGLVQFFIEAGLAVHGFLLWAGLGATAVLLLGNALVGLGQRLGIVDAEFALFNAEEFGAGIRALISGVGLLATEMITLGSAEDIAAAATITLDAAWAALDAINPVVWIGALVGGIAALVVWLGRGRTASDAFTQGINSAITSAPDLTSAYQLAANSIVLVNQNLVAANRTISAVPGNLKTLQDSVAGAHEATVSYTQGWRDASQAQQEAMNSSAADSAELNTLKNYLSDYNILLKAAGGNVGFLNQAQISSGNIMDLGAQKTGHYSEQMQQYIVEVQAAADAQQALALGTGRTAAALNAESSMLMSEVLPAMQKVTQAEDTLLNLVISGPQAFVAWQQGMQQMGTDAKVTGASLGGLNTQSVTLASDFYSTVVPAFQKFIDSEQQQQVSTGTLTQEIATMASSLVPMIENNKEAESVIVSLVNNALGPNTVSLQDLIPWIDRNSASQKQLSSDVAGTTQSIASQAGVLNDNLQPSISATGLITDAWRNDHIDPARTAIDLITSHTDTFGQHLDPGLTGSLDTAGQHSDSLKSAHLTPLQQLMDDIDTLVKAIEGNFSRWPAAESTHVTVSGSGKATIKSSAPGVAGAVLSMFGAGGVIPGYAPGHDSVPAMLSPGEGILTPQTVRALGGAEAIHRMNAQHFASGGIVNTADQALPAAWNLSADILKYMTTDITDAFGAVANATIQNMISQYEQIGAGPMGGATGSEMQNGLELYNYLLKYVFQGNKIAAAGATASIWGECLPLNYRIVTDRGVLSHDEVKPGDETLGYNLVTGREEWCRVVKVMHYENMPVVRIGGNGWHAECTPNHKWLVERDGITVLVPVLEMRFGDVIFLRNGRTVRLLFYSDIGRKDVWCVTTALGSFTTVKGGDEFDQASATADSFLTGNSSWDPFAVGTGGRGLIGLIRLDSCRDYLQCCLRRWYGNPASGDYTVY